MYPAWFCPPSLPIDVETTLEVLTSPLVIVDKGGLKVALVKCKLDHEHELELVCMEHVNEVHGLKVRIEEMTNLARLTMNSKAYQ